MSDLPRNPPRSHFPPPLTSSRPVEGEPWSERLLPLVRTLRGYGFDQLRPDFVAGLTTALFAIPQAMAYALIAGLSAVGRASPPRWSPRSSGAAFGSSEFLINGPTNAIVRDARGQRRAVRRARRPGRARW